MDKGTLDLINLPIHDNGGTKKEGDYKRKKQIQQKFGYLVGSFNYELGIFESTKKCLDLILQVTEFQEILKMKN